MGKFVSIDGMDEFFAELDDFMEKHGENELVKNLQYIGERAVKEARLHGAYIDQTGNLRSSIGYVILKDGMPITGGEPQVFEGGNEGAENMMNLLDELASKFPRGYTLIVCAGMEYASYVEDIHGLNVLATAKTLAQSLITKLLKKK